MRANGWMFWACFAGKVKGPSIVWQKEWGKITAEAYQARICPLIKTFWQANWQFKIQQDNAPAHSAKSTQTWFRDNLPSAHLVNWPPHSPDLNPIEHIWIWMKRWITRNYAVRPTGKRLYAAVEAVWIAVLEEYLLKLVHSMPRRLQAVIAAKGGYSGY